MTFNEKIRKLEEIRKEKSVSKRIDMNKNVLYDLAGIVSDANIANDYFALVVSEYIANADFECFNKVEFQNEVHYLTENDVDLYIVYGDDNKVQSLTYSYDGDKKRISIKRKGDSVCVTKVNESISNTRVVEKRVYLKNVKDGKYYNKSFYKKVFNTNDEVETIVGRRYSYNKNNDSLVKDVMSISKENANVVTNTKSSVIIQKDNYTIEDGEIFIIENNKLEDKVLSMQNQVISTFRML